MINKFLIFLFVFSFFSIGSFAAAQPFTGVPILYSPGNQTSVSSFPLSLSWSSVVGANAGYEYRITNNTTGQKIEGRMRFSTSVGIDADQLSMGYIHSWSIRACVSFPSAVGGSGGECGDWANTREFTPILSKPTLSFPSSDSVADAPVKLQWNQVSGATNYQYFIGRSKDSTVVQNIIPNGIGFINQNSVSIPIPNTEIGQTFYWQIFAKPTNGKTGPASDIWSFKTRFPRPTGVFPQGEIPYTGSLELKWTISNPAEEYLWYILDEKNNQIRNLEGTSNSLSAQVVGIDLNRSLKWTVQACKNNRQSCSEFSDPVSFKMVLAKPVVTTPGKDGEVIIDKDGSYDFVWTPMPVTQQYIYGIPNAKIKTYGGRMGNVTFVKIPKDNLLPGGQYTFKVKSCPLATSDENCSPFAERTFQTASLFVSSFSINPSAGQPPLEVTMTAQAGGLGVGTLNYTFYCDESMLVNTIGDFKNGKTLIGDFGKIVGYKIDGYKDNSFTVPIKICKDVYTEGITYNPKVIIERDNVPAASKTIQVVVGIPNIQTNLSVSPGSPLVNQKYTVSVDVFSAPGSLFEINLFENDGNNVANIPCFTVSDITTSLGGKCATIAINQPTIYTTSKATAGETIKYQAKIKYTPVAVGGTPKIFDTNTVTVTISMLPVQQCYDEVKKQCQAIGNEIDEITGQRVSCSQDDFKTLIETFCPYYTSGLTFLGKDQLAKDAAKAISAVMAGGSVVSIPKQTQPALDTLEKCLREHLTPGREYSVDQINKIKEDCQKPTTGGAPGGSWFPGAKCKDTASTTPGAIDNPLCVEDFNSLINVIINFIFWVAIALSPIMMLVAGFYYMTSAGNVAKVALANKMILYTAIGLGVILLAKGLIAIIKGVLGV